MSHFTKMKTPLIRRDLIVKALEDLGHKVQEGSVRIRGFGGQEAWLEIKVPTTNRGYDLGYRKADETYDLVAGWFGIKDIRPEAFPNRVQKHYAYHVVLEPMEVQGFEVVDAKNETDNTLRLVVRQTVF